MCWEGGGSVCGSESAGWVSASVLVKTSLAVWKVTRHMILHRLLVEPSSPVVLCQVPCREISALVTVSNENTLDH